MSPRTPAAQDPATEDTTATEPEDVLVGLTDSYEDGPVTFTRPGVESRTFQVKGGKISTTKDGQAWLFTHVVGTLPAE
jgi:hypothetical protein